MRPFMDVQPGGSIFSPTLVRRERWPGDSRRKGTPLVSPGQEVLPDQPVLRLEPSATGSGPRSGYTSTTFSAGGGKNELIPAGLRGHVTALTARGGVEIESHVIRLPGMLGVGRQIAGVLMLWQDGPAREPIPPGAVLVVPGPLSFTLLRQAVISGIVGIVASSIALRDLEGFLRVDMVKLLTSDDGELDLALSYLPQLTLLFTEGLGAHAMPAQFVALLSRYQGSLALLNGRTSPRHGLFPELLISLPPEEIPPVLVASQEHATEPVLGALVHIYEGKYAGRLGIIDYLFTYGYKFPSGVCERAARVQCEDGSHCIVPLSAIERVR